MRWKQNFKEPEQRPIKPNILFAKNALDVVKKFGNNQESETEERQTSVLNIPNILEI